MALYVIQLALEAGFILFVVTQMLFPSIQGTPWFPIFRRKGKAQREAKLRRQLENLSQEELEAQLAKKVMERRKALETNAS